MQIDKKSPIHMCIVSFVCSLVIFSILLISFKPIWILEVNKKTGLTNVMWPLFILYTITFSMVVSIIVFLLTLRKENIVQESGIIFAK